MTEYTTLQIFDMIEANGQVPGFDLSSKDLSGIDLSREKFLAEVSESRRTGPPWWFEIVDTISLSEIRLHDADLSGANLRETDLGGARLMGADLRRADLREAYLGGASMWDAHLEGANLQGAILCAVILERANLTGAHLRGANLRGTSLKEAKLTAEQLTQAVCLAGVILPDGTELSQDNWQAEFEEWRGKHEE